MTRGNADRLTLINPATEKPIAEIDVASLDDVDRAAHAAQRLFESTWIPAPSRLSSRMKGMDRKKRPIRRMAVGSRIK